MTVRPADLRFLLPAPPRTAIVDDERVARAYADAGIEVDPRAGAPVDVVVGRRAVEADGTIARRAANVIVAGDVRHARVLRRAGFHVRAVLVRHGPDGPRLAVPVRGPALAWALLRWGRPHDPVRAARNAAVVAAAKAGVPLSTVLIASRDPGVPFPLAAAAGVGVPGASTWCFTPGAGDELQRAAFHVFAPATREPGWVVKLSRRPGNDRPFDADERGLALATVAGDAVTAHAPHLLGRFSVAGLPASAETAARGTPLVDRLHARGARDAKDALVARIAAWFGDIAGATASPPETLDGERNRLGALPGAHDALETLPPVPGVLAHMDPGTWNIVSDGRDFTVLDWEAARQPAMPLWDLLYFLVDAFAMLDGAKNADQALRSALALARGEHAASPRFFALVREYVAAAGLRPDAVGPLALLGWIHHSRSHLARGDALAAFSTGASLEPAELSHLARLAEPWRSDPALGVDWPAWRR